ncbi:MAG: FAD-dependent oxidoreductase [Patescibacteria group bacterium]|nr:FAD-dependent oxidoreductase [Patescibacteria group bacterium]
MYWVQTSLQTNGVKEVETIIIGGGISGMACGNELHKAGKDFILLTKELGGRMLTSKTHTVDYGASYITTEYKNVMSYIDRGERLMVKDFYFFDGNDFSNIFNNKSMLLRVHKWIKFIHLLKDFSNRLNVFRKKTLLKEQKEVLKDDPVLVQYLSEKADVFLKKHGFEYLNEVYFNPVVNSTAFVEYRDVSVFHYLGSLIPLVAKTYVADFRHTNHKLTNSWKDKIHITSVHEVTKKHSRKGFTIKTSEGDYTCTNIVLALPYDKANMIFDVPKPKNSGVPVYVFHVVGRREEIYLNKKIVFFRPEHHDITILWRQKSGSDIVFSKVANPDFHKYYELDHIVKRIHWGTSVVLSDENFVKQNIEEGVILASDYNLTGLEDSYITGVYAANKILGKTLD